MPENRDDNPRLTYPDYVPLDENVTQFSDLESCATCGHPRWEHVNTQGCAHVDLGAIADRFCDCETFLRAS